jgi:hypothetical protein
MYLGGEITREKMENSGVLFMNVTARAEHFPKLLEFAVSKQFDFKSSDQGLIKEFYVDTGLAQWLPPQFNWKPYWGYIETIALIHFHGAKPMHLADCFTHRQARHCVTDAHDYKYTPIPWCMKKYQITEADVAKAYSYSLSLYFSLLVQWYDLAEPFGFRMDY